jgi:hypothetical protein
MIAAQGGQGATLSCMDTHNSMNSTTHSKHSLISKGFSPSFSLFLWNFIFNPQVIYYICLLKVSFNFVFNIIKEKHVSITKPAGEIYKPESRAGALL